MDSSGIIWSGLLQGVGTGFVFAPLSTIAFSTLPPHLRNEGTAFFSLMRNVGGSVGISIVVALLAQNTQAVHSRLIENLRPDNPLAQAECYHLSPLYQRRKDGLITIAITVAISAAGCQRSKALKRG